MRPNTMRSVNELPPRRLPPCTPPVTSPHANRLGDGFARLGAHLRVGSDAQAAHSVVDGGDALGGVIRGIDSSVPSSSLPGAICVSTPAFTQALYPSTVSASASAGTPIWFARSSMSSALKLWPFSTSSAIWSARSAAMSVESTSSHISSLGCSRMASAMVSRRSSSRMNRLPSSLTIT